MADPYDAEAGADPSAIAADLPPITPKQEHFINLVLEGRTTIEAYRTAYDTQAALGTQRTEASRLMRTPAIRAWLRAARTAGLENAVVTREHHVRSLVRLRELGIANGDLKSAVAAEIGIGKAMGFHELNINITRNDPATLLAELRQVSPAAAEAIAKQFGATHLLPPPQQQPLPQVETLEPQPSSDPQST